MKKNVIKNKRDRISSTSKAKDNVNTPNNVPPVKSLSYNPWPGLSPYKDPSDYKDGTRYKFCGRSAETFDLLQMIESRNVVTLYGSTGVGKTSLLRAGVFPLLKQHVDKSRQDGVEVKFCPIYVRLGAPNQLRNMEGSNYEGMPLLDILRFCIETDLEVIKTVDPEPDDENMWLWHYFHSRYFYSGKHKVTPVVVLDQFEELFVNKENDVRIKKFLKQLYVLAENRLFWSDNGNLHEAAFRFVFTLREDRFFYLEDYIDALRLTLFKENRYRLRPLEDEPARQIVKIPGHDIIDPEHEEEIASLIIDKARNKDRGDINTLMLSLICCQLYEKKGVLTIETAKNVNVTLDSYYQDAIEGLSYNEVHFLEKSFVNGENRQPVEEEIFKSKAPVAYNRFYEDDDSDYKIITDVVVPGKSNHHVELVHDQLASVINARQKAKNRRWKSIFLRVGIFAIMSLISVSLIFWGQKTENKQKHPLSLMRMEAHDFSTKDSLWVGQECLRNNTMVEQLDIEGKTEYEIDQCPYLHTIDLSKLGRDTLVLTLKNCDLLKKLILPSKIQSLSLKVSNCPKLTLSVNKGVGVLHIDPTEESMTISVESGVKRYVESDGILWDLYDRRVVYYPRAAAPDIKGQTFSCSFPSSIKTNKLSYGSVSLTNLDYEEVSDGKSFSSSGLYLKSRSQMEIDDWARKSRKDTVNYYILPDSLDYLPDGLFCSILPLDSIVMPRKLKEIHNEVFRDCIKLREVTLPQGLNSIGEKSFYECRSLKHLTIPATVTSIGKQAFEGCTSLASLEFLGDSITLGDRAFANCPALTSVKLPKEINSSASTAYNSPFYNTGDFVGKEEFFLEQIDVVEREEGYEMAWNDSGEPVIRLSENVSEIYLLVGYVPDRFNIEPDAAALNHIHLPWPQPVYIINGKKFELSFNLSKSDKQHITLHVPYGCKRYYEMNSSFVDFRNIVEDPHYQQTKNWLLELFRISKKSCNTPLSLFFIVFGAILLITAISIAQRKWWKLIGFTFKPSWNRAIGLSVAIYILTMLFYAIIFWFFKLNCLINELVSEVIAAIVALIFSILIISAPRFIISLEQYSVENFGSLLKKCKLSCFSFLKMVKWLKYVVAGIFVAIVLALIISNLMNQTEDFSKALTEGKYKEATKLYIDSLLETNSIDTVGYLRLRQLLAMAGDSAQLTLIVKEKYDKCDPNYEVPWEVTHSISYERGDSVFMFNSSNSAVWAGQGVFGRGNKGHYYDKELRVNFYDEASDSSAIVFLRGAIDTIRMAGKITGHNEYQKFIYTQKADGHKLLYDYQGKFITFDEDLPISQGSNTGLDIRKKEHDGLCYVFFHTDNGPLCMKLPNGSDVEFINKRFLIWREWNDKLLAYDIKNPNNAPVPMDNEGFFNVITGEHLKVNKRPYDVERINEKNKVRIINTKTNASFLLPERYSNIPGTITYGLANSRYYHQSDYQYGEVALFDFQNNGRLVAELEGTNCSFLQHPDNSFYTILNKGLQFYIIEDGVILKTFCAKNNICEEYTMESYYHFCGNYLIHDEDCSSDANHYARKVYSLTIPGAKPIPITNQHIFACGDSLIVVNPPEKCFYFYRYETLAEQLERSNIVDSKQKKRLISKMAIR